MKKVPASEATRKRLEEVFSADQIDPGRIVREGTRLLIEQALEAEVEQALGRRYYEHGKGGEAVIGAMRASRKCCTAPVSSMKPMPPWTCTPSEATSMPISVEKAFATGVKREARSFACLRRAGSSSRWARSMASAVM